MDIHKIFEQFPTQEDCVSYLESKRWPEGSRCVYCNSKNVAVMQHRWRCYDCSTGYSVTVGTIFHDTKLPLQKWFLAIALVLNAKKGLSALQLSRDIKVNKNTAWRIMMQIRKAMDQKDQGQLLSGIIEMDEAYIGGQVRKQKPGKNKKVHNKRGRGSQNKTPIVGAAQRDGFITVEISKDVSSKSLEDFAVRHINTKDSKLITDQWYGYRKMHQILPHSVIKHSDWYVEGDLHTNTIEGFWAILRRGIVGQYHSVSQRHLQSYINEFCYRYNLRKTDTDVSFDVTVSRGLK